MILLVGILAILVIAASTFGVLALAIKLGWKLLKVLPAILILVVLLIFVILIII